MATSHPARPRLRGLLLALVGLVSLGLVTSLSVVSPAAAAPRVTGFSYATFNVRFDNTLQQTAADVIRTLGFAEVAGFQEFSQAEDQSWFETWAPQAGYGIFLPHNGGGGAIPIVWRKDRFDLLWSSSVKVHDAVYRTDANGVPLRKANGKQAPAVSPSRFINTVMLSDRVSGRPIAVVNTHTISQASNDARETDPQLVPYLKHHLAMLRQTIIDLSAQTRDVIAGGDLNVNYLADRRRQVAGFPTSALGDLVSFNMPLQGSWGRTSLLDYNTSLRYGGLERVGAHIPAGFHSDHKPVVVQYGELDYLARQRITNNPGHALGRRYVMDRLTRAIDHAPPGARVTIRSRGVDDLPFQIAINNAVARGVQISVTRQRGFRAVVTVNYTDGHPRVILRASRRLTQASVNRPTNLDIAVAPKRAFRREVRAFWKQYNRTH